MKMSNTTDRSDVEQWLDAIDPEITPTRNARYLRAIGEALTALEQAEARLQQAVADARNAGDSWTAIGTVLGTSRQAAHRKFAFAFSTSASDYVPDPLDSSPVITAEIGGSYSDAAEHESTVAAEHQSSYDGAATESTSALVEENAGPVQSSKAPRFRRPVPQAPTPSARRGSTFHAWLVRFFTSALSEVEDLPGAKDSGMDPELEELKAKFLRSSWARKVPFEVELPFSLTIGGQPVRGRVDAVFRDDDGGCTVVDWKTGQPPGADRRRAATVQLAVYRLAVAEMFDLPLNKVHPVFVYIQAEETFAPRYLLDADGLASIAESRMIADWTADRAS